MAFRTYHLALLSLLPTAQAAQPWLTPFSPDSRAIVKSAAEILPSEKASVTVLLEDHSYKIHANGKTDSVVRKVFRVDRQDAVEDWSAVEQPYRPWYQQTPELKARVIGIDGSVSWLDPKTVSNATEAGLDSNTFSDARVLRAPLPGVAPGSIVEFEIKLIDSAPLLDSGVAYRILVPTGFSLQRFHVLLEAEPGIALRTMVKRIPDTAFRKISDSRFECELGPLAPETLTEWDLPSDVPPYPYIAFSTGRSWQAVAARYSAIVDQRIGNPNLDALLQGVDRNAKPVDIARKLVANLHRSVRYTGVEFGESAIVPGPPGETIKRGYGDCKDKAVLLTAMLRAAGLPAHVALLSANYGLDVDPGLPGLGVFNHAIVHVESVPPFGSTPPPPIRVSASCLQPIRTASRSWPIPLPKH